eukprot:436813_1
MSKKSLYERVGGESALDKLVQAFYKRVLADPALAHFFTEIDMLKQLEKQKRYLRYSLGGSTKYGGRAMYQAHRKPRMMGMNASHFYKILAHKLDAWRDIGINDEGLLLELEILTLKRRDAVLARGTFSKL